MRSQFYLVKFGDEVTVVHEKQRSIDFFYSYIFSGNYYYHHHRRRSIAANNKQKRKRELQLLSRDIQEEIITYLPATSIMRLRSVCRDWYTMSLDPFTARAQIAHATEAHLFIYPRCNVIQWYDVDLLNDHNHPLYLDDIERYDLHLVNNNGVVFELKPLPWIMPMIGDLSIIGSSNGILCVKREGKSEESMYLYNPLLGQYIWLPQKLSNKDVWFSSYGFGFDQVRSEFKVVRFVQRDAHPYIEIKTEVEETLVEICGVPLRDNGIGPPRPWKTIKSDIKFSLEGHKTPLSLVNGKLHCLTHSQDMIVSFDITSEEIVLMHLPVDTFDGYNIIRIGELGGLLSVTVCGPNVHLLFSLHRTIHLWVMKDYGCPESWAKKLSYICPRCPFMFPYMWKEDEILLGYWFHTNESYLVRHTPTLLPLISNQNTISADN